MKKQYFSWVILGIFAMLFYLLNTNTHIAIDDFSYKFTWNFDDVFVRVQSLSDIIASMQVHYFKTNGRLLVNGLAQLFLISDDKTLFDFVNTFMIILVIILVYLNAGKRLKELRVTDTLLLVLSFWFLVPGPNHTLLWLDGSINYLWSIALVLVFFMIYKKLLIKNQKTNSYMLPFLFIFGFISGFTHEVITVGVSGALFVYHIKKINKLKIDITMLIFGFMLGTLILVIAPGNFIRLEGSTESAGIFPLLLQRTGGIIASIPNYIALIVLLISLIFIKFKKKEYFNIFLKEQNIFLVSILFSFLFIILAGAYQPRVFFGIAIFSILLLFQLFLKFRSSIDLKVITIVLGLLTLPMLIEWKNTYNDLKYNYSTFKAAETDWRSKDQNVYPAIQQRQNRFVSAGIGGLNKDFWSNIVMSRYYGKEYLTFVPKHLYTLLNEQNFNTTEQIKIKDVKNNQLNLGHSLYFDQVTNYSYLRLNGWNAYLDKSKLIYKPKKALLKSVFTPKEKFLQIILNKKIPEIKQEVGIYFYINIKNKEYLVFKSPVQIPVKEISDIILFDTKNNLIAEINL